MKDWTVSYLTEHDISFPLSHGPFGEIANSWKRGENTSSPWPVGLHTCCSLSSTLSTLPCARNRPHLLHSHPSVLNLVIVSYNRPSVAQLPPIGIRACRMCSHGVLHFLFSSTDLTPHPYPLVYLSLPPCQEGKDSVDFILLLYKQVPNSSLT